MESKARHGQHNKPPHQKSGASSRYKGTDHKQRPPESYRDKPSIVKRNYHVTSQTAYHITELAMQEQTSEGRIIDKIMRSYLAERSERYKMHRDYDM